MAGPVHYEIYIRKTAPSPWTLSMATEDRKNAIETAEDLMRDRQAVAVKVTKETLDPDTMEFNTVVLMTRGAAEAPRKKVAEIDTGPACKQPGDLYTPHARELIGRVLEDWLHRNSATPMSCCTGPIWWRGWRPPGSSCSTRFRRSPFPRPRPTEWPPTT